MEKIYKKGSKYFYEDDGKLYSCDILDGKYWPHYQGDSIYEEHTIEREVGEGKKVSYNRPANWVKVRFIRDIGPRIESWGDAFDNGEGSMYYVTYLGDNTEYVYVGGPGYFRYSGEFTNVRPACNKYFEKVGNNWVMGDTGC